MTNEKLEKEKLKSESILIAQLRGEYTNADVRKTLVQSPSNIFMNALLSLLRLSILCWNCFISLSNSLLWFRKWSLSLVRLSMRLAISALCFLFSKSSFASVTHQEASLHFTLIVDMKMVMTMKIKNKL